MSFKSKYLRSIIEFFSQRKFISIIIFIILIIINFIDLSLIFLTYRNIYEIIFNKKFFYIEVLFSLIFSRIFFIFLKKSLIKFNSISRFCLALKKIFLFSIFSSKENTDSAQFKKNLLKIQTEINFTNFSANKVYFKLMKYCLSSIFFCIFIIFINYKNQDSLILNSIIFLIFVLSIITSVYFSKKSYKNYEKINSRIENDLINANYEVLKYTQNDNEIYKNNNEILEKIIDNQIDIFKKKSKKNVFFCNSEYLFYITQLFYFFTGFISICFLSNINKINDFFLFYLSICLFFYFNSIKFFNYFIDKKTLYFIIQSNITNYNTNNSFDDLSKNSNKNENHEGKNQNLQNSKALNELQNTEDLIKKINDIPGQENYSKNQVLIHSIKFQNATITHPEFFHANKFNMDNRLYDLNFSINERTSNLFITNDESNIGLFKFIKNLNFKIISGEILINNKDVSEFNTELIENSVIFINSDNINYDLTIRENIIAGNSEISEELLNRTLKISGLLEYINSLPLSYHSLISKDLITDVQKFQIALGAGFLNDGQIIILDFTNLSNENHDMIKRIKSICLDALKDRIIIFLTRSSFGVETCDNIVLFEKNRIVANGSHKSLTDQENQNYLRFYLNDATSYITNFKEIDQNEEN